MRLILAALLLLIITTADASAFCGHARARRDARQVERAMRRGVVVVQVEQVPAPKQKK